MFLLEKAARVTRLAIASRHMSPIEVTTHDHIEEGIHYVLRIAAGLKHKPQPTGARTPKSDPFMPYEAELCFAQRDFPRTRALMSALDQWGALPRLRPVINYWKGQ